MLSEQRREALESLLFDEAVVIAVTDRLVEEGILARNGHENNQSHRWFGGLITVPFVVSSPRQSDEQIKALFSCILREELYKKIGQLAFTEESAQKAFGKRILLEMEELHFNQKKATGNIHPREQPEDDVVISEESKKQVFTM